MTIDDFNVEKPDIERNLRALLFEKEAEIERLNKDGAELAAIIRQQGFENERLRAHKKILEEEVERLHETYATEIERLQRGQHDR